MSKLSIITINFNNREGLIKTFDSVFGQTLNGFEYIIIDGGSLDGSVEIIKEHQDKVDYWVSEKDNGIYDAMNKGIRKAAGKYLMFLNSGDLLSDAGVLEKCFEFLETNSGVDIYYGDMYLVNDVNHPYRNHCRYPENDSLPFFKVDTLNHQASFIKASLFGEFGYYPEEYRLAADYWLYLISLMHNKQFVYLPFPLVDYDFTGISATSNDKYRQEKKKVWDSLVPQCVQELLNENESYKQMTQYKLVKAAMQLNNKFQTLKGTKE